MTVLFPYIVFFRPGAVYLGSRKPLVKIRKMLGVNCDGLAISTKCDVPAGLFGLMDKDFSIALQVLPRQYYGSH